MNFDLSEEQELFKAVTEKFVAPVDVGMRHALRQMENGYDRKRWKQLAELGLIALAADETAGGVGGSLIDLAVVAEALGAGNAPDPWLENGALPAMLLARGGEEAHLPGVLDGTTIAAFAFAERAQRFNLMPSQTRAETRGDGYVINGEKTFVPGGAMADLLIVTAELAGEMALFAVEADANGLEIRPYAAVDGSHAGEVFLRSVTLDGAARIELGKDAFDAIIAEVRLLVAAELVGLSQRLLDETLDYVKQREQFGVAIGTFQVLQHRLVDCYTALEQSRSLLLRTALADRSEEEKWSQQAYGTKGYIAQNALHIGREAVQMHGGMGITDELAIGHAFKRALLLEKLFGDSSASFSRYEEAA